MQRERYAVRGEKRKKNTGRGEKRKKNTGRGEKRKKNTGRGEKREKILWILWYSDRDPNYGIILVTLQR